jgi:hypothetical protein
MMICPHCQHEEIQLTREHATNHNLDIAKSLKQVEDHFPGFQLVACTKCEAKELWLACAACQNKRPKYKMEHNGESGTMCLSKADQKKIKHHQKNYKAQHPLAVSCGAEISFPPVTMLQLHRQEQEMQREAKRICREEANKGVSEMEVDFQDDANESVSTFTHDSDDESLLTFMSEDESASDDL